MIINSVLFEKYDFLQIVLSVLSSSKVVKKFAFGNIFLLFNIIKTKNPKNAKSIMGYRIG
jgi:hypothetical protein